jgi:hypothetical protein
MIALWNKTGQNEQWLLTQKMRKTLKEYSKSSLLPAFDLHCNFLIRISLDEVLIQQTTLANYPPPTKYDRETFQH